MFFLFLLIFCGGKCKNESIGVPLGLGALSPPWWVERVIGAEVSDISFL